VWYGTRKNVTYVDCINENVKGLPERLKMVIFEVTITENKKGRAGHIAL